MKQSGRNYKKHTHTEKEERWFFCRKSSPSENKGASTKVELFKRMMKEEEDASETRRGESEGRPFKLQVSAAHRIVVSWANVLFSEFSSSYFLLTVHKWVSLV